MPTDDNALRIWAGTPQNRPTTNVSIDLSIVQYNWVRGDMFGGAIIVPHVPSRELGTLRPSVIHTNQWQMHRRAVFPGNRLPTLSPQA